MPSDAPGPPADPFSPYVPSAGEPWDLRRVSHLLRRVAFAATEDRTAAALKQSPAEAVNSLLDYDVDKDPFNDMLDRMEGFFTFKQIDEAQNWWIYRMFNTPRPAQERLALFWHNRFATSALKVDQPRWMHQQIELFRQKGLGNFRDLLVAVGRDPAMLVWLDGQSNKKGHANENYAREVMELFTLGIGNYTEKDVQELARAMTGWAIDAGKALFVPDRFDAGPKSIFGKMGKFDGESAADLLLSHPAAPRFLARKLLREFVHPSPADNQIAHVAQRLLEHRWEIKPVMKDILTSRLFFSDWAYRSKIKGPVEFAVGAGLALGGRANTDFFRLATAKMGQALLLPPNVKGWDGEEAWINANTVLLRFNFALRVATMRQAEFARRPNLEQWFRDHALTTPVGIVNHFVNLLLDGNIGEDVRVKLVDFMNLAPAGKPKPFVFNHESFNTKVRDVLHLIMTTPEYQLS